MRKSKYEMSIDDAYSSFDKSPYATLSCVRDNGHPYSVVLSMARNEDVLYFHCANEGDKIDILKQHPKVCISAVETYVYEDLSTYYRSTIMEGTAHVVEDDVEKVNALRMITKRFDPEQMNTVDEVIAKAIHMTCVYKVSIQSISGKHKLK